MMRRTKDEFASDQYADQSYSTHHGNEDELREASCHIEGRGANKASLAELRPVDIEILGYRDAR